MTLPNWIGPSL